MTNYSRTTLRELKKCLLANLMAFSFVLPSMAEDISKTYENTSIDNVYGYSSATEGLIGKPNIDVVVKNTIVNDGPGSNGSVVGFELTNNTTDYLTADVGDVNVSVYGDSKNRVEKYIWGVNLLGLKNGGGTFNFDDVTINAIGESSDNELIANKIFGIHMGATPADKNTGYYMTVDSLTINANHYRSDHATSPVIYGVYHVPAGNKLPEYSVLKVKNNLVLNLNDIEAELVQLKDGGAAFYVESMILNLSNSTIKKLTTSTQYPLITGLKNLSKNEHIGSIVLNISDSLIDTHVLGVWNPGENVHITDYQYGELGNLIISLSGITTVSGSVLSGARTHGIIPFNPEDLKVSGQKKLILKNGNINIKTEIDNLKFDGEVPGISGFDEIEAKDVTLTTPLMRLGEKLIAQNSILNVDKIEVLNASSPELISESSAFSARETEISSEEINLPKTNIELVNSKITADKLKAGENLSVQGGVFDVKEVDLSLTEKLTVDNTTFKPEMLTVSEGLDITSNGGVIDLSNLDKTYSFDNVTGENGATFILPKTKELSLNKLTNGVGGTKVLVDSTDSKVSIGTVANDGLTVMATGKVNDTINNSEKLAQELSKIVSIDKGNQNIILKAQEGKITPEIMALSKNGVVQNVKERANTVTESVKDVMGLQVLSFRNQINDVQKRIGDLRLDENFHGTWVRTFGGDVKFGDMGLKNKYNTIQAGADFKKGNAYLGIMASLTEGESDMDRGTGEDKTYGMGVYAGYMTDNGWYVDATAKQMHLQNKFKAKYNTGELSRGSYKTWGTSVSLEAGKRMNLPCGFFVEPQAEIMYGRVQGIDYTTSAGVKVEQEAFESLIGRAGLSVGKTFKDKGSVYANVSLLNDFAGKVKTSFSYWNQETKTRDDMGGAWTEFAVGGTYKLNKNTAVYGEFATSKGTDLTNPVQWSLGLRFIF